jgi:hypothetical protein
MAWLKEHWVTSKNCPICAQNKWIVAGDLVTPVVLKEGGFTLGGPTFPQFMLVCGNCGHTHYFNAIVAKLQKLARDSNKTGGSDSGDTS